MAETMATLNLVKVQDKRIVLVPPRPLTFDEFVDMFGEDEDVELIDGVVVQRMATQLEHEKLQIWLLWLLNGYVKAKGLGVVLGSRTAVQITEHRGRLPDILVVSRERADIVKEKGVYGAPDLVIEILSPQDRPVDIVALEVDYQSIGVAEIWFIDRKRKQVRVLRKREEGYSEEILTRGALRSDVVNGFGLEVEWLFEKSLPSELDILRQLSCL